MKYVCPFVVLSLALALTFAQKGDEVKVTIDLDNVIGEINPYIYGHFIEHLDGCVYGGIWNGKDFNQPVIDLIKALKPPIVRWPGGNFASGYHWLDGIGPVEKRPPKLDLAWNAIDPNTFGTDEYIKFCRLLNTEPYICVNMGSGTAEEAANWVEYCNRPAGSYYANLRAANGNPEPYKVKFWGLGNEVYGDWQIGHTDARTYALQAAEFSKRMKWVDKSIKTIAVGCDDPQWNWEVLRIAGRYIDYISLHKYYGNPDYYELVASPLEAEESLERLAATILAATGERRIKIAFDEWNIWTDNPRLTEAIFAAGIFNALHRLCEDVHIACQAQLVNVLPLIKNDEKGARPTPPYFVFKLYANNALPLSLQTKVESETYVSRAWGRARRVPFVDVTTTADREKKRLVLFIVNRDRENSRKCEIRIKGWEGKKEAEVWELNGKDVDADTVEVMRKPDIVVSSSFEFVAPPHSLTVIKTKE